MASRSGYRSNSPSSGDGTPGISEDLAAYAVDYWPAYAADVGMMRGDGPRVTTLPVQSLVTARNGFLTGRYLNDFYYRIHVLPSAVALGNLVSAQVRTVRVWNAWLDQSQTMTGAHLTTPEGIDLTLPDSLPLVFAPLQEEAFELSFSTIGPPVIDTALVFSFTGLDDVSVTITGIRLQAWPLPPDWGRGLDEALQWLTEVQPAINGDVTTIPLRDAPRRSWEFGIVEGRRERRIIENMLYDWTARIWALPVWVDVTWLATSLSAGVTEIPVSTAGLDFSVGGLVMLWADVQRFEMVEVATIEADKITLARATLQSWSPGARLYPCRSARLTSAPEIARKSDRIITSRARFEATEPCDWPAIEPAIMYLGFPVHDQRGDEGNDPTTAFDRQLVTIDGDVGLVDVDDVSGLAWQRQSYAWRLHGRAERAANRSLLYWLSGQAQRMWVPTWADDVELVEATNSTADTMRVAWSGIARYLRQQTGRQHLRIELYDGTVWYRRVSTSVEVDADSEQIAFDSGLGQVITPQQVRQICWMTLSRQAADRVEIAHMHDSEGLADVRTSFVAAGREEP